MKILVMNGPNLSRLGTREPGLYGQETLEAILKRLASYAQTLGASLETFQSDIEGELVTAIGNARACFDGILINPAAYTHSSVALRDAISACGLPAIEIHLTNTHKRETFRQQSLTVPVCVGQIMGFGGDGYLLALDGLVRYLKRTKGA